MIAAAQVLFHNEHGEGCLDWLATELRQSGVVYSRTEWRGYSTVVPQLLVPMSPVSLTIQVESDPEYVPQEIGEVAEKAKLLLSADLISDLASCDARLDIMSAAPTKVIESNHAITVFAETDLDPANLEVEQVLSLLSKITDGFIMDCVNGRLRAPGDWAWTAL